MQYVYELSEAQARRSNYHTEFKHLVLDHRLFLCGLNSRHHGQTRAGYSLGFQPCGIDHHPGIRGRAV